MSTEHIAHGFSQQYQLIIMPLHAARSGRLVLINFSCAHPFHTSLIIKPLCSWSPSTCIPIHQSEHNTLYLSTSVHCIHMTKQP